MGSRSRSCVETPAGIIAKVLTQVDRSARVIRVKVETEITQIRTLDLALTLPLARLVSLAVFSSTLYYRFEA